MFAAAFIIHAFITVTFGTISYDFTIDMDSLKLEDSPEGMIISFPGSVPDCNHGGANLPVNLVRLAVPIGFSPTSVTIINYDSKIIENIPSIPVTNMYYITENGINMSSLDADRNRTEEFESFESQVVEIVGAGNLFGARVLDIIIHPVKYDRTDGRIKVFSRVQFIVNGTCNATNKSGRDRAKVSTVARDIKYVSKNVQNPEAVLSSYSEPNNIVTTDSIIREARQPGRDKPDNHYVHMPYLIITNEDMEDSFEPLKNDKINRGLGARITTVESILSGQVAGSSPSSGDRAEAIRSYIQYAYRNCGTRWVLLGGDVEIIPTCLVWAAGFTRWVATDQYYACLDGNWNSNGNAIIGDQDYFIDDNGYTDISDQMDLYPDVFVGRIPARNASEASTIVSKLDSYNNDFEANDYRNLGLIAVSDASNNLEPEFLGNAIEACLPATVDVTELYPGDGLTKSNFLTELEDGYSLVFVIGHGNEFKQVVGPGSSDFVTRQDYYDLDNTDKCGLMISIGCEPGMYNSDCIGEAWLRAPEGGGVGFIGSSTYDNLIISLFNCILPFNEMCAKGEYFRMGEILATAKLNYTALAQKYGDNRMCYMGYNLLGDPEAYVWTDEPHEFEADPFNETYVAGEENDADLNIVDDITAIEVPHASLSLRVEDDFYYSTYSDEDGDLESGSFFPDSVASASFTVVAPNYKPYTTAVSITSGTNEPTITGYVLTDDCNNIDNNQIDAGERFTMNINVYNSAASSKSITSGVLTCIDTCVTVNTASSSFPTIGSQQTVTNSTAYDITLSPWTPDSLVVTLNFAFTDGVNNWSDSFDLLVHAPEIEVLYSIYNDDSTSDPDNDQDHVYDKSETFYLDLALINKGSGATSQMTGTLTSTDQCVSSITGTYTFVAADGCSELHGFGQVEVALNSTVAVADIAFQLDLDNSPPGRDYNDIGIDEPYNPAIPVEYEDLTFQQFGREGIELLCEPADDEELDGYRVYRNPGPNEEQSFTELNNGNLITGGSRYVDYLAESGETYIYKFNKVVDGFEMIHSENTTAWFAHPLRDDFPVDIGFGYPAGAAITDFDGDGDSEFWIGTNQAQIVQVNADGTSSTIELKDIDHPNAPNNLDKVNLLTKPAVGNVDGDPRTELIFGANFSDGVTRLLIFEWAYNDAELVFDCSILLHNSDYFVTEAGMPSLYDMNEDGRPEISIITFDVGDPGVSRVHLKEYTLNPEHDEYIWTDYEDWDVSDALDYTICTPAFGDISGEPHLFFCNGGNESPDSKHFVYDSDGDELFELELDYKVGSVVLGNIDNADNDLETVFIDSELALYARDAASVSPHAGADWPANTNTNEAHGIFLFKTIGPFNAMLNQPVLADINGDDDLEIIVGSPDSIYVYENDGSRLANWPQARNNQIIENWCGSALVADIDDDSDLDIVMANGHHQIEAWDGTTGAQLSCWPIVVGDRIIDYSIKDIDDDDDLELIVTTGAGYLYIYELGTGDGEVVWGQKHHDNWHTNNYEFGTPAAPNEEPLFGCFIDDEHPYVIARDSYVPADERLFLGPGVTLELHQNVDLEVEADAHVHAVGTSQNQITITNDGQNLYNHIKFATTSAAVYSEFEYCIFEGGYDGLYVTGLAPLTGALEIDNCTFSDCNYGLYINSSKVNISNSTIEDNSYNGIYLTSCSAGKVVLDGNTIQNNGTYGSIYDAGVSLSTNSDPEIINCEITGNIGGGIYCVSSTPDLNTYSTSGVAPNTIHENGIGYTSGDQDGSDGAEIYLSLTSYPRIGSNNIWDTYYDMGYIKFGAFIYKETSLTQYDIVNAKNNYWGPVTVGESDFRWTATSPPKTFAEMFYIYPDSSELIDDVTNLELAMGHWAEGEYEDADEYFRLAVDDEQSEAINAIHYLTGTTLKLEGDLGDLRTFYLDIIENCEDEEVVKVAQRFATNCLSELGEFEDAAEEYDLARQNAETLNDSILAVIDYLAVSELAEFDINTAEELVIPQKITSLLKLLEERGGSSPTSIIPKDYILSAAFPNPFNSVTMIKFGLPEQANVRVSVYDASGRLVKILANGVHPAGYHTALLNGKSLSSGIYFYRIDTANYKQTRKLILLR